MYSGEPSTTMSCDCGEGWHSIELIAAPIEDYREVIDRIVENENASRKCQSQFLSERAHMLRKKWLPHRPKKVRWRKG